MMTQIGAVVVVLVTLTAKQCSVPSFVAGINATNDGGLWSVKNGGCDKGHGGHYSDCGGKEEDGDMVVLILSVKKRNEKRN
ncbi:hypothetical protein PIB30_045726 [Stylosanthes scabra]|uniref:Uncharacterized protein n=1 Tax=Stylosanthes scabra TaxID=79078 RepID=A0ABU6XHG3_9FABA|nr:hypothetical protein [Stylosanthes scabra]